MQASALSDASPGSIPRCRKGRGRRSSLAPLVPGVALKLTVEPLGLLFAMVAGFLWPVTSLYAIGYMRAHHERNQTRFYACFAVSIAAAMGVAFADNLVTLFVFYEVLTLSTYPLVTHAGTAAARRAGRVYLATLLGTSIGLQLLAIAWTYAYAGTVEFREGGILAGRIPEGVAAVVFCLFAFGVGKAALMPFHAGDVLVAAHRTEVSELGGLGRRMPVTMGAFVVASLCIIGLPPLGGAWSKWYLATAAVDAGEWVLLGVLLLSSLLSLGFCLRCRGRSGPEDAYDVVQFLARHGFEQRRFLNGHGCRRRRWGRTTARRRGAVVEAGESVAPVEPELAPYRPSRRYQPSRRCFVVDERHVGAEDLPASSPMSGGAGVGAEPRTGGPDAGGGKAGSAA